MPITHPAGRGIETRREIGGVDEAMSAPALKTIKRLFAVCRNQCAFPGCHLPIAEETSSGKIVVTGEICHIKAASPGGSRYDPAQNDDERNDFDNLVLLCPRHHKIIDSDPGEYTVDNLIEMKKSHEQQGIAELNPKLSAWAEKLYTNHYNITINKSRVNIANPQIIKTNALKVESKTKKVIIAPPEDSIAGDPDMYRYIKYLIDRYNKFQYADKDKQNRYKYMAIYGAINREFKNNYSLVPQRRFDELVGFLQRKIDKTKIGRIQKSRGRSLYHSYDNHPKSS